MKEARGLGENGAHETPVCVLCYSASESGVIRLLSPVQLQSEPPFPKRLPEKLKAIRERLGMTPDDLAPFVSAKTGAEILAYENDEDDLLVSVLWGYARLSGNPIMNLLDDTLEVNWTNNQLRIL